MLQHIRDELPELRSRINNLIISTQSELTSLGDLGFPGKAHRGSLLLKLVTTYVTDFHAAIEGTLRLDTPSDELIGGARLNQIFNEVYANSINEMDHSAGLSLTDVRNAIRNASGPRPALFVPEASFEVLARKQIAKLASPAQRCLDLTFEELQRLAHRTDRREFRRFPKLAAKLVEATNDLLRERIDPAQTMIEGLLKIEMAYINTNHPDFRRSNGANLALIHRALGINTTSSKSLPIAENPSTVLKSASDDITTNDLRPEGGIFSYLFKGTPSTTNGRPLVRHAIVPNNTLPLTPEPSPTIEDKPYTPHHLASEILLSEKEEIETQLILSLLQSYYAIVRKNLLDTVPKAIMHYLVNYVTENLGTRLVSDLYREELFAELLEEDEGVVKQRARCKTALEAYRQAATILSELRDTEIQHNNSE